MSRARKRRRLGERPLDPAQTRLRVFSAPRIGRLSRTVTITLGAAGRVGLTAKEVAVALRVPLRTTYRVLGRLEESSIVERTKLGTWALTSILGDVTTDPDARLGFENVRWRVTKWQTQPPPPCRMAKPWTPRKGGDAEGWEETTLVWEGRDVKLAYHPGEGVLEVAISSRGVPIPLGLATELSGWLKAMLGLGQGEESECTHIEVNAMHEGFRADGWKYLEIRRFGEFANVMYQKAAGLKHEVRLYRPLDDDGNKVSIERTLEILAEGSPLRVLLRIVEKEFKLYEMTQTASLGAAPARREPTGVSPAEAQGGGYG